MERGYNSAATDYTPGAPPKASALPHQLMEDQPVAPQGDSSVGQQDSNAVDGDGRAAIVHRSDSAMSQPKNMTPSRGGTLKKKQSLKKTGSIRRSSSVRSKRAGSVRSLELGDMEKYTDGQNEELYSAFFTPVPTTGNPTDILANRFQDWRKVLKDLITYYRDVQKLYESRSKSLLSISNVVNNTTLPPALLTEGGISQATHILGDYHKQSVGESNKARTIEEDVILQLTGLRSDLQQKIKEIKSLAGDFKNAVDKETDGTRKAVRALQESLGFVDTEPGAASGKGDPFILRLGVERQLERQIDEENYLHRAFLNLENSGRELESIVVGEIQKAYNAYASILKREADEAYEAAERLRTGPIAMRKDLEWNAFVDSNDNFVDPRLPVRKVQYIHYPGKDEPAAAEVRSGMLERKSKYLKSYTPGWYVLSPTHLHEFKSADHLESQAPVMSLYLPEQKLGSHSTTDSSSHKFMLKGRQTGAMHRGHGWVFRAESHETMLAWYEDIKSMTEKTGEERNAYVRKHARSFSGGSHKAGSVSSDGALDEDEADHIPYSATTSQFEAEPPQQTKPPERPQPGGRFPSDLNVNRGLRVPLSPSSGTSSDDRDLMTKDDLRPGPHIQSKEPSHGAQQGQYETHTDRQTREPAIPGSSDPFVADVGGAYSPPATPSKLSSYEVPLDQGKERERHTAIIKEVEVPAITSGLPDSNTSFGQSHHFMHLKSNHQSDQNRQIVPVVTQASAQHHREYNPSSSASELSPALVQVSEYDTYPVQSHSVSSDGAGAVAYASPQQELPVPSTPTSGPSFPVNGYKEPYSANEHTETSSRATPDTAIVMVDKHQPHKEQLKDLDQVQSKQGPTSQLEKDLRPHRENGEQSNERPPVASNASHIIETTTIQEKTDEVSSVDQIALDSSTTPPVELDPNGSTPRTDDVATFGSTFASGSIDSPVAPMSATIGQNSSQTAATPSRPILPAHPSIQTISDLHVPGEFPSTAA